MGINRIRLQAGSTEEMIKAQEAAAQDPELDRIRQQLFGEGYVQDIGEGKGIAQYYTGFGLPQSLTFTPAPVEEVAPVADVIEPVVPYLKFQIFFYLLKNKLFLPFLLHLKLLVITFVYLRNLEKMHHLQKQKLLH